MAGKEIILEAVNTKDRTRWSLSEAEFAEFQMRFEENELIDISNFKIGKLTLVDPPTGKEER